MPDGLTIETRHGLGIASIMARRSVATSAIAAVLGIDLPTAPRAIFAGDRTVIGTGPGTWLLVVDDAAADFSETLAEKLAGLASVSDQSSGYRIQRLSGRNARTLLQRGAAIDLHPSSFGAGSAATTVIAHIGVILWQVDARSVYDVATFRSYSESFHHWTGEIAASLSGL